MNRLILKYATPITTVILVVFAWVVYRRIVDGGLIAILPLAVTAVIVWAAGTFLFVFFWPRITVGGFKRVFTTRGLGGGPIPVNTLYAAPQSPSRSAAAGTVIATGADDLVYLGGWLDVKDAPLVLHVPETGGRYYSIQFTDPASGANFAYLGTRTTGANPGDFLLCGAGWSGTTPTGMTRIDLPHHAALLIGRVFASDDVDREAAYALAKQVRLRPHLPK